MAVKLSKIEKFRVINLALILLVCLLAIIFVYTARIRKINSLSSEVKSLNGVLKNLYKIQSNISDFEDKKSKVLDKINEIKEKIPIEPAIPQVIEQITKPLGELGISLVAITPLEPVKGRSSGGAVEYTPPGISMDMGGMGMGMQGQVSAEGDYIETPIELSLQATYRQLGIYLEKLRHLSRLIVIDEFDIKSNKEISPRLDIKLKISVFHYGKE